MSEETIGAQKSVPYAIILSVVVSAVMGYVFLIALLLSIQVSTSVNWLQNLAPKFRVQPRIRLSTLMLNKTTPGRYA